MHYFVLMSLFEDLYDLSFSHIRLRLFINFREIYDLNNLQTLYNIIYNKNIRNTQNRIIILVDDFT